MTGETPSEPAQRFEIRGTVDSHMGWIRTRLAAENTMLAYLRTSVSLIGFGFAIVQALHNVRNLPGSADPRFPDAPLYMGLALIFCGIVSAVIAMIEFRFTLRYLWSGDFVKIAGQTTEGRKTPLYAVGGILIVIGLFAFFSVLVRLL